MKMHYVLKLWEPATPAFCSSGKIYVGSKDDLLSVAEAMKGEDGNSETEAAIRNYFAGDHTAVHHIAYQEIPILTPVRVLASSHLVLPEKSWEHMNVWGCPYEMRYASAEIDQIVIKYEGAYHRCVKARLIDLSYKGITDEWVKAGGAIWGNACVLKTERLPTGNTAFKNLLYVQEDSSEEKEPLVEKLCQPESVILDRLCDEIFGDG